MSKNEATISKVQECGIGICKPKFLQRFADIRVFLAVMSIFSCVQSAFAGYGASQNTTLEKRFSIGSFLIGTINACFEIGSIIFGILITYHSHRAHIPRWLSFGLLFAALGSLLFGLPYFIMPEPHFLTGQAEKSSNFAFIIILFFAQFCIGIGSSPILTLAPTFIDSHVHSSKSPPMLACLYAASALGPVFGFALGTVTLNLPENLVNNPYGMQPSDSQWIGAWWFGYLLLGSFLIVGGFILSLFPRSLKRLDKSSSVELPSPIWQTISVLSEEHEDGTINNQFILERSNLVDSNKSEPSNPERIAKLNKLNPSIKKSSRLRNSMRTQKLTSLPQAVLSLLSNKVYMVSTLTVSCEMFTVIGFGMFCPKYLENVYQISSVNASLVVGGLIIPAGAIGILSGGFLSRFLDKQKKTLAITLTVLSGVTFTCLISFLFFGCPKTLLSGINAPSPNRLSDYSKPYSVLQNSDIKVGQYKLLDKCHEALNCSATDWKPVCDSFSGITFISKCFAGCKLNGTEESCDCVSQNTSFSQLTSGLCPLNCNKLYWFVGTMTLILFLTGITQNPLIMLTLRSVSREEGAFALAFQFAIVRVFAYVPSAIAYGKIMDSACELWRTSRGNYGDCAFSNRETMMKNLTSLAGSFKFSAFLCYFILFLLIRMESGSRNKETCRSKSKLETRTLSFSEISIHPSQNGSQEKLNHLATTSLSN